MKQKFVGQKSTYFIKRELEELFDLPKQAQACKVVVTYKKHRIPVQAETVEARAVIADWQG